MAEGGRQREADHLEAVAEAVVQDAVAGWKDGQSVVDVVASCVKGKPALDAVAAEEERTVEAEAAAVERARQVEGHVASSLPCPGREYNPTNLNLTI